MAVKDEICKDCGKKIGIVDSSGWARKILDWKAYLGAFVAIAVFVAFFWWAFMA